MARFYATPEFRAGLEQTFAAGHGIKLNLAPPLFARKDPDTGHFRKREFGPWMLNVFTGLAKLKGLRGSPFDLFGYSAERKSERALIVQFEDRLETILKGLTVDTHDLAISLVAASGDIRGFGHVKEAAIKTTQLRIAGLTRQWSQAAKGA